LFKIDPAEQYWPAEKKHNQEKESKFGSPTGEEMFIPLI
jgi:hypothetical protein